MHSQPARRHATTCNSTTVHHVHATRDIIRPCVHVPSPHDGNKPCHTKGTAVKCGARACHTSPESVGGRAKWHTEDTKTCHESPRNGFRRIVWLRVAPHSGGFRALRACMAHIHREIKPHELESGRHRCCVARYRATQRSGNHCVAPLRGTRIPAIPRPNRQAGPTRPTWPSQRTQSPPPSTTATDSADTPDTA
ncbi:hypothetical protein BSTEL_1635 [Bifidobacterium stellenboschense]|uniref:Uncharacterized protein n=1 Tax=Bifidobacterium stellenboschense TaxID=762211 RepID=A0A087DT33_9BIFI|nr:hypothetical protein BSTEL_1635 [Bifidobacterium stellenboschense]